MHIILGIIALATAAYFLIIRARNAAEMTHEIADVASDLIGAARRFGFRRKYDQHPVDAIEDQTLATGSLALALNATGPMQTTEMRQAQQTALRKHLRVSDEGAEELLALGTWFINECGSADAAVTRLAKKLLKLGGQQALDPALAVVNDTAGAGGGLSDQQREALGEVARIFGRK